jgi:hypothetical protein
MNTTAIQTNEATNESTLGPVFENSICRLRIWGSTDALHYEVTLDRESASNWRVRWSVKRPKAGTLCPVNGAGGGGTWKSWKRTMASETAARAFLAQKLDAIRAAAAVALQGAA